MLKALSEERVYFHKAMLPEHLRYPRLSEGNPLWDFMDIVELPFSSQSKRGMVLQQVNDLVGKVEHTVQDRKSIRDLEALASYMPSAYRQSSLLTESFMNGAFDCKTRSLVYLAVAHELHWPLIPVVLGTHLMVRWDDGGQFKMNYETTSDRFFDDSPYLERYGVWYPVRSMTAMRGLLWYMNALVHAQHGRVREMMSGIKHALGHDPSAAATWCNCAMLLYGTDLYDEALAFASEAGRLEPNSPFVHFVQGAARYRKGDVEQAMEDLDRAIALRPGLAEAHHYKGLAYHRIGDIIAALEQQKKAIACHPHYARAYAASGRYAFEAGTYPSAIRDLTRAIELDSDDIESFHFRAKAYWAEGDKKNAMKDLARVLRSSGL